MSTPVELARLAAAVNLLRPDWPTASLQTYLERRHADRPLHDLAVALVWVATDPASTTPARLEHDGPWWRALTTSTTPIPPRYDPAEYEAARAASTPPPDDFRDQVQAARPPALDATAEPTPRRTPDPEQLAAARAHCAAITAAMRTPEATNDTTETGTVPAEKSRQLEEQTI